MKIEQELWCCVDFFSGPLADQTAIALGGVHAFMASKEKKVSLRGFFCVQNRRSETVILTRVSLVLNRIKNFMANNYRIVVANNYRIVVANRIVEQTAKTDGLQLYSVQGIATAQSDHS
jgi:hypothetical protein